MKREEFASRVKKDPSLKWLTDEAEGVLSVKINPPSTIVEKSKSGKTTQYAVTLKDGKLAVETELPDREMVPPPQSRWWMNLIAAIAMSAAAVTLGWRLRALFARKSATPPLSVAAGIR
ncbi:hypothetical protein [Anatilimnocola floriformis]|uniref:hypothetical protein n=1 Tax=Anatilimnocola floriformis TaxID=2948575 RepID=UPI0020C3A1BF|nr:hypothetical protein [Anatilimnocola floriformis]